MAAHLSKRQVQLILAYVLDHYSKDRNWPTENDVLAWCSTNDIPFKQVAYELQRLGLVMQQTSPVVPLLAAVYYMEPYDEVGDCAEEIAQALKRGFQKSRDGSYSAEELAGRSSCRCSSPLYGAMALEILQAEGMFFSSITTLPISETTRFTPSPRVLEFTSLEEHVLERIRKLRNEWRVIDHPFDSRPFLVGEDGHPWILVTVGEQQRLLSLLATMAAAFRGLLGLAEAGAQDAKLARNSAANEIFHSLRQNFETAAATATSEFEVRLGLGLPIGSLYDIDELYDPDASIDQSLTPFWSQIGSIERLLQENRRGLPVEIPVNVKGLLAACDRLLAPPKATEGAAQKSQSTTAAPAPAIPAKVFLVHGHDNEVLHMVARFLEKLGLQCIVLREKATRGQTVIEKFERHSDVQFAVVLLTPDDLGRARAEAELKPRARQNVFLELGFFIGKLGRDHVCPLVKEGVEIPSDYDGVIRVKLDDGGWRQELARELREAGLPIRAEALLE